MNTMLRNLFCLLVLALLAIPTPGDEGEGGENASGTGVWILPACAAIDPAQLDPSCPTRGQFVCSDMSKPVKMKVSQAMGCATGTFTDDVLGTPVSLSVSGSVVEVPASLMATLAQSPNRVATIVVSDSEQKGYVLRVTVSGTSVQFDVK